jgi:hypothetical protein
MKTVPSGAEECFMKGALMVGGTAADGYVGMPKPRVREAVMRGPSLLSSELALVLVGSSDVVGSVLSAAGSVVELCFSSVELSFSSVELSEVSSAALSRVRVLSSSLEADRLDSRSLSLLSLLLLFWAKTGAAKSAKGAIKSDRPGRKLVGLMVEHTQWDR